MHMALFVVRDGFSRNVCPNPALTFQARMNSDTCADTNTSHTHNNVICIYSQNKLLLYKY